MKNYIVIKPVEEMRLHVSLVFTDFIVPMHLVRPSLLQLLLHVHREVIGKKKSLRQYRHLALI